MRFSFLKSRRILTTLVLLVMGLALVGCSQNRTSDPMLRITGPTMGTSYHIALDRRPARAHLETLQGEIDRILVDINDQMSTYQADSELSRFNTNRITEWVDVSAELFTVVDAAVQVSRMTQGAFDATVGVLVNLWGFGSRIPTTIVPSDTSIAEAMEAIGYGHLHLQGPPPRIRKDVPDLYIDLSGIAKGYAVDRIAIHLESIGIENYLVEIGGELRTSGDRPSDIGWEVVIERPMSLARENYRTIRLRNVAIATSGDYRNYIERDGQRFSHVISPNTGKPITHNLASVTVIDPSAMRADALATGLMILGPDVGYALAIRERVAAFFLVRHDDGFKERNTPAWDRYTREQ